jgi:hypothetical protein
MPMVNPKTIRHFGLIKPERSSGIALVVLVNLDSGAIGCDVLSTDAFPVLLPETPQSEVGDRTRAAAMGQSSILTLHLLKQRTTVLRVLGSRRAGVCVSEPIAESRR